MVKNIVLCMSFLVFSMNFNAKVEAGKRKTEVEKLIDWKMNTPPSREWTDSKNREGTVINGKKYRKKSLGRRTRKNLNLIFDQLSQQK